MAVQRVPLRDRFKEQTRQIILGAFASCLTESDVASVTYADIAARAGIGQRTVYRYFPTRDDLLKGLYKWFGEHSRIQTTLPRNVDELTTNVGAYFAFFESEPDLVKAVATTPQGHEMRVAMEPERSAAYLAALEDIAKDISEENKRLAAAAIQHMCGAAAWVGMRAYWKLDPDQAAKASVWAIKAMLASLRRDGDALFEEETEDNEFRQ